MNAKVPPADLSAFDRSRAARINLAANYATIAFAMIQGVVMVPLYLSRLGRETYGVWLVTGNVIAWLSVIDPGLSTIIQQQVAEAAGANNRRRVEELLGVSLVSAGAMFGFVLAVGLLVWPVVLRYTPGAGSVSGLAIAYHLAVLGSAMMLGYYLFGGVFIGLQTTGALSFFYVGSTMAGVAAMAYGLLSGWGVVSLALARCVTAFILFGAAVILTYFKLRRELELRFVFSRATFLGMLAQIKYTVVARAIGVIASNVDSAAIGWWIGPSEAVLLTVNKKAADICAIAVDRLGVSFMPGLAHRYGSGDVEGFKAAAQRVALTYWLALIVAAGGVLAFNRLFVMTWVGRENAGAIGLTGAVVFAMFASQIGSLLGNVYVSMGKIAESARVNVGETIVRLGILIIGLKASVGVVAVPIATAGSVLAVTMPYYGPRLRWLVGDNRRHRAAVAAFVIVGGALVIGLRTFTPSWGNLVMLSGAYAIAAAGIGLVSMPAARRIAGNILR